MSEASLLAAGSFLRESVGLDLEVLGRSALEAAVRARAAALGVDPESYGSRLSASAEERQRLVDAVVVGETWWLRDRAPFTLLASEAVKRRAPGTPLTVLCVPCASGEEAYSIAATLLSAGLAPSDFVVDAVDVSEALVERARRGVYGPRSLREAGAPSPGPEGTFVVDEPTRASVRFSVGNVTDPRFLEGARPYDVVFCRNLLIYLHAEGRRRCLSSLVRLSKPGGLFFGGHAEALAVLDPRFQPFGPAEAFAYVLAERPEVATAARGPRSSSEPGPRAGASTPAPSAVPEVPEAGCWTTIGVMGGDRSCPELASVTHCRNCPVFASAARRLFDRPAPAGYAEAWRKTLETPPAERVEESSVVVFRLAEEWLAVETALVVEVAERRAVHRIPHRAHSLVSGLVNIRGQLQLCLSLEGLLEMPRPRPSRADGERKGRLLVLGRGEGRNAPVESREEVFVVPVAEVFGVHRFVSSRLVPPPVTLSAALLAVTRGLFPWEGRQVGLLQGDGLLAAMRRVVG